MKLPKQNKQVGPAKAAELAQLHTDLVVLAIFPFPDVSFPPANFLGSKNIFTAAADVKTRFCLWSVCRKPDSRAQIRRQSRETQTAHQSPDGRARGLGTQANPNGLP